MANNGQNRWKNYGLWAAALAFIPLILTSFGLDVIPSNYDTIINALLGILVMAGIISNPTTASRGFRDDTVAPPSDLPPAPPTDQTPEQ